MGLAPDETLDAKTEHIDPSLQVGLDAVPGLIWSALPDGRVDFTNRAWRDFAGADPPDRAPVQGWLGLHVEDAPRFLDQWQSAVTTTTPFHSFARFRRADGEVRHLMVRGAPSRGEDGKVARWFGTCVDIEDQTRAELALVRSEARVAEEEKLVHAGRWSWDVVGQRLTWSDEAYRVFGFHPQHDQCSCEAARLRVHVDDLPELERGFQGCVREKTILDKCVRVESPHGAIKFVRCVGHPVMDSSGRVIEVAGTVIDVSEQRRATAALAAARNSVRLLREHLDVHTVLLTGVHPGTPSVEVTGSSPAITRVQSEIAKVAPTDTTVLITGEAGTGKGRIATAIHRASRRARHPFVRIDCSEAIAIDSVALAHPPTPQMNRRSVLDLKRVAEADCGTIFLDGVDNLSVDDQRMLLRILESMGTREDDARSASPNVRVIAGTSVDLQSSVDAGTFQRSLYFRLNVFPICVPPLRDRLEDIPHLVAQIVGDCAHRTGKSIKGVGQRTLELLTAHDWPGNLAELQNIVERAIILSDGDMLIIDEEFLRANAMRRDNATTSPLTLQDRERLAIEAALAEARGRVSGPAGAAARLGIPRSTLESKIKSLQINKHQYKFALL